MMRERVGHTLQTPALVNEAYLKLIDATKVREQNRAHFFAISAGLMRRILVDFALFRAKQGNVLIFSMAMLCGLAGQGICSVFRHEFLAAALNVC